MSTEYLSKYQKKQIERMTATLEGQIAFKICELEKDRNVCRKFATNWEEFSYRIEGTDITLAGSDDFMVWRIWRFDRCKPNRYYLKIIPRYGLSYDQILDILEASTWLYV